VRRNDYNKLSCATWQYVVLKKVKVSEDTLGSSATQPRCAARPQENLFSQLHVELSNHCSNSAPAITYGCNRRPGRTPEQVIERGKVASERRDDRAKTDRHFNNPSPAIVRHAMLTNPSYERIRQIGHQVKRNTPYAALSPIFLRSSSRFDRSLSSVQQSRKPPSVRTITEP
jgi:hypothetical protein